jgi:hypothetical protein
MKNLTHLTAWLLLAAFSGRAAATVLDIDFNGSQFLLGSFESAESGADFYRYDSPALASANPVYPGTTNLIPLQADALQIFSHTDTRDGSLSFGAILERPNGSGGGSFAANVDWSSPAVLTFVDDPDESGVLGAGGPQSLSLAWIDCCTDGFVIGGLDPETLFLNLTNVVGSDLSSVIFLSPDGQNSNTVFDFPTEQFSISIAACDPATDPNQCQIPPPDGSVSAPGTLALFGLGLAGFAVGWSKRKKV